MKGVFAPVGAYIPGKDMTLGVGKIRDVESRGMLVSEAELQISDDHDGIIELPDDAPVGENFAKFAGLDDPVIEINLTPNRGDGTGVHGIARDLAAAEMGKFKDPAIKPVKGEFPCPVQVKLDFGATPSLCPAFALRLVRGVKNGPSPDWLQKRLTAIGLRPINALVDITNFITYDRGRPLHVFDAAKVHGNLTVRRARPGETLLALDGKTYTLDDSICVIADENGVESLSGIMGGEATGCSEATADVLIESALWEPMNIAQTGRKLGINSDARYRFERGVDPAFMLPGLELATRMVMDLCGGKPSEIVVAGNAEAAGARHRFSAVRARAAGRHRRAAHRDAPRARTARFLRRRPGRAGENRGAVMAAGRAGQGRHGRGSGAHRRRRPRASRRRSIAATAPRKPVLTPIQVRTRKAKRALAARNLIEAVTWSFIAKTHAELFGGGKPELALANPIAADLSDMRPSLIPGLVAAAQKNADRGFPDVGLFEVGQIFRGDQPADQFTAATGYPARAGKAVRHRPALVEARRRSRRVRCQGRRARGAYRGRRAGVSAASGAGRPGLVSSRPFRHDPDRAAERARPFRRIASERARSARCRRPAGRLRSDPRAHP